MPLSEITGEDGHTRADQGFALAVTDPAYRDGILYASKSGLTGPVVDQATILRDLANTTFQDNADQAIHRFLDKATDMIGAAGNLAAVDGTISQVEQ